MQSELICMLQICCIIHNEYSEIVITEDSSLCSDPGRGVLPESSPDISTKVYPNAPAEIKPEIRPNAPGEIKPEIRM
uniref:Uncharacterized protein n=1 Tax=Arundo donax TaxID=35708 RepID=A0A0A9GXM5_ARUDO